MNRRTLKKHCKRAMEVLIRDHCYHPDDFTLSDGDDSLDAPRGMERRFVRNGFLEPGPLKGTPIVWDKVDYFSNDMDCALPSEVLRDLEFWATFEPSAEDLAEIGLRPPLSTTGRGSDNGS